MISVTISKPRRGSMEQQGLARQASPSVVVIIPATYCPHPSQRLLDKNLFRQIGTIKTLRTHRLQPGDAHDPPKHALGLDPKM
jgi:hypothetical protein